MRSIKMLAGLSALAFMASCSKHIAVANPPAPPPAAINAPATSDQHIAAAVPISHPVRPATPDAATKLRIQDLIDRIQDIYFDYDQHNLRPDAQNTLQSDATTLREILREYPTYKLTVEGFCDERGSDAYNLALGDSRAKKAEQFLETLGLPASQLRTVSFGKEKPVCTEATESCWQKNRRAHITQDQEVS